MKKNTNSSKIQIPIIIPIKILPLLCQMITFTITKIIKNNGYHISNTLKNLPFVSIIVPARNEEKHIKRCLLSLLSQDYPYFEIIAIDDNSTDSTLYIMNNIKNKTSKGKKLDYP